MPTWTYPKLKAAYLALAPAPANDIAAATALNAQVSTAPQDIATAACLHVFLLAGEWPNIVLRSRGTLSGASPATAADNAVKAAIAAVQLTQSDQTISASDPQTWTVFTASLQALLSAGDISQTSVDAITALRAPAVPVWQPPVSAADVFAARTNY